MPENPPVTAISVANSPFKPLMLDLEKYRHRLDDHSLTDEQKDEYLTALWQLVLRFTDLNMPLTSEKPDAQNTCGQPVEDTVSPPDAHRRVVYSKPSHTKDTFTAAANAITPPTSTKEAS